MAQGTVDFCHTPRFVASYLCVSVAEYMHPRPGRGGMRDRSLDEFADAAVAAARPPVAFIAAAMLLSGVLLVTISAGVFGVLTLGGLLSPLSKLLPSGREPPRRAR